MNSQRRKCWLVGTHDLGYLLYWTDTRTRARIEGAREMCTGWYRDPFEHGMYLRALRVPDLDELPDVNDDRTFLVAGLWVECSGCHRQIDLEPYTDETHESKPYLESLESRHVWCQMCARDIEGAFEATRDDLIRAVRTDYRHAEAT